MYGITIGAQRSEWRIRQAFVRRKGEFRGGGFSGTLSHSGHDAYNLDRFGIDAEQDVLVAEARCGFQGF
jgi:hypothetical protein